MLSTGLQSHLLRRITSLTPTLATGVPLGKHSLYATCYTWSEGNFLMDFQEVGSERKLDLECVSTRPASSEKACLLTWSTGNEFMVDKRNCTYVCMYWFLRQGFCVALVVLEIAL